jgi:hypothetical protein
MRTIQTRHCRFRVALFPSEDSDYLCDSVPISKTGHFLTRQSGLAPGGARANTNFTYFTNVIYTKSAAILSRRILEL